MDNHYTNEFNALNKNEAKQKIEELMAENDKYRQELTGLLSIIFMKDFNIGYLKAHLAIMDKE